MNFKGKCALFLLAGGIECDRKMFICYKLPCVGQFPVCSQRLVSRCKDRILLLIFVRSPDQKINYMKVFKYFSQFFV